MKKRIFALFLVCIMLIGIVPAASAEDAYEDCVTCEDTHEHVAASHGSRALDCPVCGLSLKTRVYTVDEIEGSVSVCYYKVKYEQDYCNQHGDIGTPRELSPGEAFGHNYYDDPYSERFKCRKCGRYTN